MSYEPTIGLEVHAELKTATKMFCSSKNDTDEKRPNVNICPICLAHPGTLPAINKEAVRHVLRIGIALGGTFADYTEFDRKNYFYPDIPKGYQISQYEYPLVSGGSLNGVAITRIHLEEDTARSSHDDASGETLIDFNRSGLPLMELVTEPVIKSADETAAFARELQLILRYLGISDADMEKGEMRIEANISVSRDGTLGTKVEVKNLNSFRSVERAVSYEVERQKIVLESGGKVLQETRGWDDGREETFSQRAKEVAADYRYFPDPDLPSLKISEIAEFHPDILRVSIPELPSERRMRYAGIGIKSADAEQYVANPLMGAFFDAVMKEVLNDRELTLLASNYVANDLANLLRDTARRDTKDKSEISIEPRNFAILIRLIGEKMISSRGAKDILAEMLINDAAPDVIAKKRGLFQVSSPDELRPLMMQVIERYPNVVADYRNGKDAALKYLIGQGMRESKGAGNPEIIRAVLLECLNQS